MQAEVEKKSFLESQPIDESFQVYFRTLPYIMMAVLILAVTTVMMVFNKPDLRMRNLCAPVKLRHVNLQLALYNVCLGGVAWLVLCAMGVPVLRRPYPGNGCQAGPADPAQQHMLSVCLP